MLITIQKSENSQFYTIIPINPITCGGDSKDPPALYAIGFPFEMKFHHQNLVDFFCIRLKKISSLRDLVNFWQLVFCRKSPPFPLLANAHIG